MGWISNWKRGWTANWKAGFAIKPANVSPVPTNGLLAWYDASTTATGAVASWTDKSGNGNSATQATGAKQPVCTANQKNGLNTLIFASASSQTLAVPAALFVLPNGSNTAFYVAHRTSESGAEVAIICLDKSGAIRYYLAYVATAGSMYFQSKANTTSGVTITGNTNTNYNIMTCSRVGTLEQITVNNGTPANNTGAANEPGITGGFIGSINNTSNFFNGGIGEILIYNRALSAGEITQVNTYLSTKWAITIS